MFALQSLFFYIREPFQLQLALPILLRFNPRLFLLVRPNTNISHVPLEALSFGLLDFS